MNTYLVLQCLAITPPNADGEGACIQFGPADLDTFQPKGAGSFTLPVRCLSFLERFQVGQQYAFHLDLDHTAELRRQSARLSSGRGAPP